MPDRWNDRYIEIWCKNTDKDDLFSDGEFSILLFADGTLQIEYMEHEGGRVSLSLDELKRIVENIEEIMSNPTEIERQETMDSIEEIKRWKAGFTYNHTEYKAKYDALKLETIEDVKKKKQLSRMISFLDGAIALCDHHLEMLEDENNA